MRSWELFYLFLGYTAVWLALALYLFSLGRRQGQLERQVEALRHEQERRSGD